MLIRNRKVLRRYKSKLKDTSNCEPESYPCIALWLFRGWKFIYPEEAETLVRAARASKALKELSTRSRRSRSRANARAHPH